MVLLRLRLPPLCLLPLLALLLVACNSTGGSPGGGSLAVTLSSSMVLAPQDGTPASVSVTVTGASSSATVAAPGLPAGITAQITQPGASGNGTISFSASPSAPAGSYPVTITASAG